MKPEPAIPCPSGIPGQLEAELWGASAPILVTSSDSATISTFFEHDLLEHLKQVGVGQSTIWCCPRHENGVLASLGEALGAMFPALDATMFRSVNPIQWGSIIARLMRNSEDTTGHFVLVIDHFEESLAAPVSERDQYFSGIAHLARDSEVTVILGALSCKVARFRCLQTGPKLRLDTQEWIPARPLPAPIVPSAEREEHLVMPAIDSAKEKADEMQRGFGEVAAMGVEMGWRRLSAVTVGAVGILALGAAGFLVWDGYLNFDPITPQVANEEVEKPASVAVATTPELIEAAEVVALEWEMKLPPVEAESRNEPLRSKPVEFGSESMNLAALTGDPATISLSIAEAKRGAVPDSPIVFEPAATSFTAETTGEEVVVVPPENLIPVSGKNDTVKVLPQPGSMDETPTADAETEPPLDDLAAGPASTADASTDAMRNSEEMPAQEPDEVIELAALPIQPPGSVQMQEIPTNQSGDGTEATKVAERIAVASPNGDENGGVGSVGVEVSLSVRDLLGAADFDTIEELRMAANRGHLEATFTLGLAKLFGIGVPADEESGYETLITARARKHGGAAYVLGVCNLEGLGCERNPSLGRQFLVVATDFGNRSSFLALGRLNELGIGGEENPSWAVHLYRDGATKGDKRAMERLIQIYTLGIDGVSQANASRVKKWKEALKQADTAEADALRLTDRIVAKSLR